MNKILIIICLLISNTVRSQIIIFPLVDTKYQRGLIQATSWEYYKKNNARVVAMINDTAGYPSMYLDAYNTDENEWGISYIDTIDWHALDGYIVDSSKGEWIWMHKADIWTDIGEQVGIGINGYGPLQISQPKKAWRKRHRKGRSL